MIVIDTGLTKLFELGLKLPTFTLTDALGKGINPYL